MSGRGAVTTAIRLTIDGREVEVPAGTTIWDATANAAYHNDVAGLTHLNKEDHSFSAYRFHEEDPILFEKGLRLTLRCGEEIGNLSIPESYRAAFVRREDVGMFEIRAVCDPLNLEMSTRELFVELERLRHFGPTEDEMERARRILLSGQAFDLEEVLGQANTLAAYEADGSYRVDLERPGSLDLFLHDWDEASQSERGVWQATATPYRRGKRVFLSGSSTGLRNGH